jgi:hypothetical protein
MKPFPIRDGYHATRRLCNPFAEITGKNSSKARRIATTISLLARETFHCPLNPSFVPWKPVDNREKD